MKTSLGYMLAMNFAMKERYPFACSIIAVEMGRRLKDEGHSPQLIGIHGFEKDGTNSYEIMEPIKYGGKVKWHAHYVSKVDNEVYDPMVGYPMDLKKYCLEGNVFTRGVIFKIRYDQEKFGKFLEEYVLKDE
ncbi:hypothetical protein HOD29_05815 [archaeon]|jgi:hypothetical protein|nr:hypothetical protein [archaeon]